LNGAKHIRTKKYNEPTTPKPATQKAPAEDNGGVNIGHVNEKLKVLLEGDSKLRSLIDWSEDEQQRHNGDRSAAEYGLVGKLVAVGFSDPQIDWIMCHVSRIGKWAEEGDHYRYEMTVRRLRENEAPKAEDAADVLADLPERCKEVMDVLKDRAVQKALHTLRKNDRLKFEILLKKASVRGGVKEALLSDLDNLYDEPEESDTEPIPEEIRAKAEKILESGDPIQARCDHVARYVHSDGDAERALVFSCESVFMPKRDKLHSDISGSSQAGKSERAGAVHSTYPPENVMSLTEASPKSLYYLAQKMKKEGKTLDDMLIYIDDGTIEFSSDKFRGRIHPPKSFLIFGEVYPVVFPYDSNTPYPNKFSAS